MEGTITMSNKELQRVRVMEQVVGGALKLKDAAELLVISYRQVKRLKGQYRESGPVGMIHGNRGRVPCNVIAAEVKQRVIDLSEGKYSDFNDTHFVQMLTEREGIIISRESVRKMRRSRGQKPKRKRRAVKHRSRRPRKPSVGMLVQCDGSPHHWFGRDYDPCCLLTAIDDASSKLLAALLVPEESSEGYLRLLTHILQRYGIPLSIYHDRHSIFARTDDYWSLEEQLLGYQYPTHFGRVLQDLNICSLQAYSPQAKGRVERGFATLQDRLIAEIALEGITDIEAANDWLKKVFINHYNRRFAKTPESSALAFRTISKPQIYQYVAYGYEAVVGNDNCVRLGGLTIDIPRPKHRMSYAKKKVLVRQHIDGKWSVWDNDSKIASYKSTPFREPVRSWKRRTSVANTKGRHEIQVYLSSKPAASIRGQNPFALKGTY